MAIARCLPVLLCLGLVSCLTPLGTPRLAKRAEAAAAQRAGTASDPGSADSAQPDSTPSFAVERAVVAEAWVELMEDEGFELVLDERPGLGAWRLMARGEQDQRFFPLVGTRQRLREVEAKISSTASGKTRVQLVGRLWLYAGPTPPPGSTSTVAAKVTEWRERDRLEAWIAELERRLAR